VVYFTLNLLFMWRGNWALGFRGIFSCGYVLSLQMQWKEWSQSHFQTCLLCFVKKKKKICLLPPSSLNTWHSWPYYECQCIILSLNILNNILVKIMKIWYFENTHRDESNDILYDIIYLCILVEKYGQS